jgi:hypothetical protein
LFGESAGSLSGKEKVENIVSLKGKKPLQLRVFF